MDLNPYLSSLQQALANATRTSSPEVQEAAERLSQTLEPALRLSLMELASDVAADVTLRLDGDVVEVRLRGGAPEIVVEQRPRGADSEPTHPFGSQGGPGTAAWPPVPPGPPAPPVPPVPPEADEDGSTTRISLRLPEGLKARVDDAASTEGLSVNSWLVRTIQKVLAAPAQDQPAPNFTQTGRRMTGWVR
ncbi:hypothetical protein EXU48_06400 [Occultella glacieicola]|uniref:Toxin-antitoxin system HicB family antitoxin n=1 Tax=Occultella glacieicola TaxID=2518684 RepID=A0ABY2E5L7_9MICO|nr:hypothetical protein [Occultella glacieicola]TDE95885.1 hypothetical protein EXU48_06400 [Occultella glacieicola]